MITRNNKFYLFSNYTYIIRGGWIIALIIGISINCSYAHAENNLQKLHLQIKNLQLSLAILQLNAIVRTYKPFERELSLVQQLSDNTSELRIPLDNMLPHATTGVATIAELRDSFGIMLLPKLYTLTEEEISWTNQMWTWFLATLTPWQASLPSINVSEELVKSAMNRLSEDDLQGAVDLIIRLDGAKATLTARWLKEANARLTLDTAMEVISNVGMTLLKPIE